MTYDELKAQLDEEYDRAAAETLSRLKKIKPLTKQKLAKALFEANKAYWAARLALIDADMVYEAERTAAALAVPYANAMETFAGRVRNIYAGYQSAFDLSKKDAKELLEKVRYDRTIAENLRTIAEGMPDGEDKTRILAEISAPAYRYRLQRAEKMSEQAKEVCDAIARGEIRTDRALFQTQTEKAYNITLDEITNGREPAGAVLDAITPEPEQLRILEMPRVGAPIEDFSPTTDRGVLDSFSLINTKAVRQITEHDWAGKSFSERIWGNTGELAKEVKQVLLEGELTGASEADMAAKISERFQVGMYKARRVVRTESNYCVNQAELKGMKDTGFDEYEFMSLHEERDCETCDDLDGEVFRIADAVVGVNMPPIHPFCRCKITTKKETVEDIQADIDRMLEGTSIEELERKLDEMITEQEKAAEGVDKSRGSGIMESEGEYGYQYGEEAIKIDREYIDSDDYAKRFDNITDNPAVNKTLLECSREALYGNDGTKHEYMYIIDANTGKVLASCLDSPGESGVVYNDEIRAAIANAKEKGIPIIGLHNHPEGAPPSVDDFNKAHDNGYVFGFIPGHNGQLYMYSDPGKTIAKEDVETIHFNIGLLCRDGADPDRVYRTEYEPLGLKYQIIGDDSSEHNEHEA